jgi:hypothetical protein
MLIDLERDRKSPAKEYCGNGASIMNRGFEGAIGL